MKTCTSVLAATLLLASSVALAVGLDDSQSVTVTIDPPTGSIHCGFVLSGNIRTPKAEALAYGFFFRSELNIVTALDRSHPIQRRYFPGPETLRVTADSRAFLDDSILQKHKLIQVKLRVWYVGAIVGNVDGGGPQTPPLSETAWMDVPATSGACAADMMKPSTGPSLPVPVNSATPPHPGAPAPNLAPIGIKHQILQRAP